MTDPEDETFEQYRARKEREAGNVFHSPSDPEFRCTCSPVSLEPCRGCQARDEAQVREAEAPYRCSKCGECTSNVPDGDGYVVCERCKQ